MDIKFEKVLSVFLYILLAVIFAFSAALVMPVYRKYVAERDNVAELRERQLPAVEDKFLHRHQRVDRGAEPRAENRGDVVDAPVGEGVLPGRD